METNMRDFSDVLAFHSRFDLPRGEFTVAPPTEQYNFRLTFLHEEIDEYHEAFGRANLVGCVDALIDFVYVAIGTALFCGTPRNGHASVWPTFRTAKQALVNQGVLDEMHYAPALLDQPLHMLTCSMLRFSVRAFEYAYGASVAGSDAGTQLMVYHLKEAADYAYKAAALMHVPWENCWQHVQAANMAKRRANAAGTDSKRSSSFDVVKPKGWKAPEAAIATELMLEGWRIPDHIAIDNISGKVRVAHEVSL